MVLERSFLGFVTKKTLNSGLLERNLKNLFFKDYWFCGNMCHIILIIGVIGYQI